MDRYKLRHCTHCGKELHGRLDKKFCDAYCRNTYNNLNRSVEEQRIIKINSLIRSNRKILKDLCPQGKATVRREVLEAMGYDFNFFSSFYPTKVGIYYLCYDYGFSPIVEKGNVEKVLIIQKQEYMDQSDFNPWKYIKT